MNEHYITDAVKAGAEYELDVLGLPFGTDRQGQEFDTSTDIGLSVGDAVPAYYFHGFAEKAARAVGRIGRAVYQGVGEVAGKAGHVFRVTLDRANALAARIYDDATKGEARASSDSASHLVRPAGIVGKPGRVSSWPIFALSLMDARTAGAAINQNAIALAAAKAFLAESEQEQSAGDDDALKAGAVFAKRNRDRIEAIQRALDEMLAEFKQQDDSEIEEAQKAMDTNTTATPAPAFDMDAFAAKIAQTIDAKIAEAVKAAQRPDWSGVKEITDAKQMPAVKIAETDPDKLAAKAFGRYIRTGDGREYDHFFSHPEDAAKAFYGISEGDSRFDAVKAALNETTAAQGAYLVPTLYSNQLVEALNRGSIFRQIAGATGVNVQTVAGTTSFKVPTLTNSTKAILTAEATDYSEVEPTFGEVEFVAYKYTKLVKASEEFLQDSRIPVESMVSRDAGNAFALAENEAFSVGSGSGAPQGVVTGATVGVTTSATNAITAEEVIDLYHAVAEQYRSRATWLMKDSTLKMIRKLRESGTTGAFLWQPALSAGEPPTILGRPVYTVPDMAAATTGLKAIAFGDMSYFTITDFLGLQVQRLNELYAATGQIGFRWYKRFDSNVMLSAAVQVLKIA